MSHCTKCSFDPPCRTQEDMTQRHGLPAAFATAARRAIGEISIDEAENAIRLYTRDWVDAGRAALKGG